MGLSMEVDLIASRASMNSRIMPPKQISTCPPGHSYCWSSHHYFPTGIQTPQVWNQREPLLSLSNAQPASSACPPNYVSQSTPYTVFANHAAVYFRFLHHRCTSKRIDRGLGSCCRRRWCRAWRSQKNASSTNNHRSLLTLDTKVSQE